MALTYNKVIVLLIFLNLAPTSKLTFANIECRLLLQPKLFAATKTHFKHLCDTHISVSISDTGTLRICNNFA